MPAVQETWVQSLGGEIPWRREWQFTPVFSPEKFHGQRSLAGYSPQGLKESDTTELLSTRSSEQAASEMKGEDRRKRHAW